MRNAQSRRIDRECSSTQLKNRLLLSCGNYILQDKEYGKKEEVRKTPPRVSLVIVSFVFLPSRNTSAKCVFVCVHPRTLDYGPRARK